MDSASPLRSVLNNLSGEWQINLENRIPRKELYQARIASSKPSLGFFVLLLCAAVIATLGLISNSPAVVIGAMIVAPLMDPILSLAFALSISNNKLAKRSLLTVVIGVITVVATAALLASLLDVSEVNREMTSRTAPNLIDLGVAVAAAVAGSFSMTRERLSNSLAGVAIAVALVPPLCVCGIGLSMGNEVVAVFGRGTVAGITNQISEGSFLLFLVNLIGITVASLFIFLVQRYGSVVQCWRNLLLWLALLGLLCIPLSSALHDFNVKQKIVSRFDTFKAGQVNQLKITSKNAYLWQRVRLLFSNVRVLNNKASVDLVLSAPRGVLNEDLANEISETLMSNAKQEFQLDDIKITISVIPNQINKFSDTSALPASQ
ncbi:TIGR00341 family protein [Synechococcus sp. UW179A]|uniref:TIGR00341 family protein n=1 Tax=Synechococcus sp. UW179A TaxID=2575510 RepID=UPI000E0F1F8F|nr:TIGR00341 family protein [Synechococcus sp. UW179A]